MNVKQLCENNEEHRYEIVELRERISALEEEIKTNERQIWKACVHEWKWDTSSGMYENNCYYCKNCKLWRNPSMYK
jgi:hypothetical protein